MPRGLAARARRAVDDVPPAGPAAELERLVGRPVGLAKDLSGAAEAELPGELLEDLVDVGAAEDVALGVGLPVALVAGGAVALRQQVVFAALGRVGKDGVGLVDLLHLLVGRGVVLVAVRMVLEGETPVSRPDIVLAGALVQAECLVVVLLVGAVQFRLSCINRNRKAAGERVGG